MIQGGWPFVSWAYGIAYGGLALYGLSLWYRIDQETPNQSKRSRSNKDVL